MHQSPLVARWELALRIRQQRLDQGLSVDDVVSELGFSRAYWSAVENDRTSLSEHRFRQVLDLFDLTDEQVHHFQELRAASKEQGWWVDYSDLLGDEALRLFGLEDGASTIRCFESSLVPGLLQTKAYTAYLIASHPRNAPATISRRVEIRRRRQDLLFRKEPPRITAVLNEAAINKVVGSRQVLLEQLHHLIHLAKELPSTLDVRVIPFSTPSGPATGPATLVLFDFEGSDVMPTVAYREAMSNISLDIDPSDLGVLEVIFDRAMEASLGPEESLAVIREQIGRLEALPN